MSGAAAADARARRQARLVGEEIVRAQGALGLSDRTLGRLANVAPSTLARIKAGDGRAQLNTICRVTGAVGLEFSARAFPGRGPRLRDTGQLEVADGLRRMAHAAWRVRLEVAAGEHGQSADEVFFGPTEIILVEIERLILDWQAQYRPALRKREALATSHDRPVRLVIAVEDTRRNRRVLAEHASLINESLPARSRQVMRAIRTGEPLGRDGLLWVRRSDLKRFATPAAAVR